MPFSGIVEYIFDVFVCFSESFPPEVWTSKDPQHLLSEAQLKLKEAADNTQLVRAQRDKLAEEKNDLERQIQELNTVSDNAALEHTELRNHVEHLGKEKIRLSGQKTKLQAKVDEVVRELDALRDAKADAEKQIDPVDQEVNKLKADLRTLIGTHAALLSERKLQQTFVAEAAALLGDQFNMTQQAMNCLGAMVLGQPTAVLEQIQLAIG